MNESRDGLDRKDGQLRISHDPRILPGMQCGGQAGGANSLMISWREHIFLSADHCAQASQRADLDPKTDRRANRQPSGVQRLSSTPAHLLRTHVVCTQKPQSDREERLKDATLLNNRHATRDRRCWFGVYPCRDVTILILLLVWLLTD